MLFLHPMMLAGAFNVSKGMMLADPAYEAYVSAAGIDGSSDWHVDDVYSCGGPPCSAGWDFPTVTTLPTAAQFGKKSAFDLQIF
jgi:hypothetical protein